MGALCAAALLVAQTALSEDPYAGRREALGAQPSEARMAAEALVLLGDGQGALDVLRRSSVDRDDPRIVRLEVDALEVLRDEHALRAAALRLKAYSGWEPWADRAFGTAGSLKRWRLVERVGLGLFALALALLGIGGARSLLAVRWPSVWMALVTVAAVAVMRQGVPRAMPIVALIGVGFVAVVHAASAAVDRTRPDARGRLLTVALMLLATGGLSVSVVARVSLTNLMALIPAS